ncbi:hypothetical protein M427DRAFT_46254 [Gonapodya prolifera JEL478]|uniref:SH3 domain-containing protein n=1 Tax=Gonapodya prolifera (strain JEL478) TaxID=1344416 RepID=A0A139A7X4_GONPJ|nr:hypothetical protein M427DRAFT_46254 [Gonapodya prolifera JEL478]|eukprot:KXS12473.1 hypothetical protein M427DRAFT_46254 [Gonapodya prolifera JEL478]
MWIDIIEFIGASQFGLIWTLTEPGLPPSALRETDGADPIETRMVRFLNLAAQGCAAKGKAVVVADMKPVDVLDDLEALFVDLRKDGSHCWNHRRFMFMTNLRFPKMHSLLRLLLDVPWNGSPRGFSTSLMESDHKLLKELYKTTNHQNFMEQITVKLLQREKVLLYDVENNDPRVAVPAEQLPIAPALAIRHVVLEGQRMDCTTLAEAATLVDQWAGVSKFTLKLCSFIDSEILGNNHSNKANKWPVLRSQTVKVYNTLLIQDYDKIGPLHGDYLRGQWPSPRGSELSALSECIRILSVAPKHPMTSKNILGQKGIWDELSKLSLLSVTVTVQHVSLQKRNAALTRVSGGSTSQSPCSVMRRISYQMVVGIGTTVERQTPVVTSGELAEEGVKLQRTIVRQSKSDDNQPERQYRYNQPPNGVGGHLRQIVHLLLEYGAIVSNTDLRQCARTPIKTSCVFWRLTSRAIRIPRPAPTVPSQLQLCNTAYADAARVRELSTRIAAAEFRAVAAEEKTRVAERCPRLIARPRDLPLRPQLQDIRTLRTRNSTLEQDNTSLRHENASLRQEASLLRNHNANLVTEVTSLCSQVAALPEPRPPTSVGRLMFAIADYDPQDADEIRFGTGDAIFVNLAYTDGWRPSPVGNLWANSGVDMGMIGGRVEPAGE